MDSNIIGILPCAGTASRIGNLPKFMFPMEAKECLLSIWIKKLIELNCARVVIPCSDVTYPFVRHITDKLNDDKVIILNIGQTLTMNETIIKSISDLEYDLLIMGMPDTFVTDINTVLIERLIKSEYTVGTYLWKLRKSQLGKIGQCRIDSNYVIDVVDKQVNLDLHWGWGVLVWKKAFEKYIIYTHQHPGYSLALSLEKGEKIIYEKCVGSYYDCGTLEGYKEFITPKEPVHMLGMIIIFAVYTSRTDISDTVSKCLEQARKIYPEDIIIAVNNNSPCTTWKDVAIKNKIIIMDNTGL